MTIKAIETRYKGYRFRSRLEARWAVFFDALGIRWEYEKEGFDFDGERYLPDFWLPDIECWIEIKGQKATDREVRLAGRLAEATGHVVYIFDEPLSLPDETSVPPNTSALAIWGVESGDIQYCWCECPGCGLLGITFNGRGDRLSCHADRCKDREKRFGKDYCEATPRLSAAYEKAMSARFEHGETP